MDLLYQTIEEFIKERAFYHITLAENRQSIIENGLRPRNGSIYVVRTCNEEVAKLIFEQYVIANYTGDPLNLRALIVKIDPRKAGLTVSNIQLDHATNSPVLKVHNMIRTMSSIESINDEDMWEIEWRISEYDKAALSRELNGHPNRLRLYYPKEQLWEYHHRGDWDNEWETSS